MKLKKRMFIGICLILAIILFLMYNTTVKKYYYEMKDGIHIEKTYQQHNALIFEVKQTDSYTWYVFPRHNYILISNTPTIINCSGTEINELLQIMRQAAQYEKIKTYFPIIDPHFTAKDIPNLSSFLNLWVEFDRLIPLDGRIHVKSKKVISIIDMDY